MKLDPFSSLRQFSDHLKIVIFEREDDFSDVSIPNVLHASTFASLNQVHGKRTVIARAPSERMDQADGIVTDIQGLALSVRWADCQNFVVYAPKQHVVGLIHAGWRGLIAGALEEHFRVLKDEWNISPADVWIGAGPSLCTNCAEFSDPMHELGETDPEFFEGNNVNLHGIADAKLTAIGVPKLQQERLEACPCCNRDVYWTYRGGDRDAVLRGKINALAAVLI